MHTSHLLKLPSLLFYTHRVTDLIGANISYGLVNHTAATIAIGFAIAIAIKYTIKLRAFYINKLSLHSKHCISLIIFFV